MFTPTHGLQNRVHIPHHDKSPALLGPSGLCRLPSESVCLLQHPGLQSFHSWLFDPSAYTLSRLASPPILTLIYFFFSQQTYWSFTKSRQQHPLQGTLNLHLSGFGSPLLPWAYCSLEGTSESPRRHVEAQTVCLYSQNFCFRSSGPLRIYIFISSHMKVMLLVQGRDSKVPCRRWMYCIIRDFFCSSLLDSDLL